MAECQDLEEGAGPDTLKEATGFSTDGMSLYQKFYYYAPNVVDVPSNLWNNVQDASKEIFQLHEVPKDIIKMAERAIISSLGADEDLRVLVTGKTGQGKSTLINGLLGAKVAKEGAGADRCTTEVEVFKKKINGVPVVVFDSPGLQDNTSNEEEYITKMRETCQKLSLGLYCTKMINTRLTDDDKKAMKKLTEAFGQEFWNHAVFVLTFANKEDVSRRDERDNDDPSEEPDSSNEEAWGLLEKTRFEGRVQIWKEELHRFLINDVKVDPSIVHDIPVIPTGDHVATRINPTPLRLPDRDNWFQKLWETCCFRIEQGGLFLKINRHRMTADDDGSAESEIEIPAATVSPARGDTKQKGDEDETDEPLLEDVTDRESECIVIIQFKLQMKIYHAKKMKMKMGY